METNETTYVIRNTRDGTFWNSFDGWTGIESAQIATTEQRHRYHLPIEGEWVAYKNKTKSEILSRIAEVFSPLSVDVELWGELDSKDDGDAINVPLSVMDLLAIREIIGMNPSDEQAMMLAIKASDEARKKDWIVHPPHTR